MKKTTLGVLGGLGPAASAHFYSLVTKFTKVDCDQDHIDIILYSSASTPDRTAFITGKSYKNPLSHMQNEILNLVRAGAGVIAIPCNTAEYFHSELQKITAVPIIRTAYETVGYACVRGTKKLGILATDGAIISEIYQKACNEHGIDYEILSKNKQKLLNKLIYQYLKRSVTVPDFLFLSIVSELYNKGCDSIVLGCTELSLIYKKKEYEKFNFIDSLAVLAVKSIQMCGYELNNTAKCYIENKKQG